MTPCGFHPARNSAIRSMGQSAFLSRPAHSPHGIVRGVAAHAEALVRNKHWFRGGVLRVRCLAPPLRYGNQTARTDGAPAECLTLNRASLAPPLRSGPKLALMPGFSCSLEDPSAGVLGAAGIVEVFGVEFEQPLKRRNCIHISQRIGV